MSERIEFTVLGPAAPQGSMKNIARKGKKSMLIHSNKRTVSWRDEVGQAALEARAAAGYHQIFAGRHIAVGMSRTFYFRRPPSVPRGRPRPSTAPDEDKLGRAVNDALQGILYANDGQVVEAHNYKFYGLPERAEIRVWVIA